MLFICFKSNLVQSCCVVPIQNFPTWRKKSSQTWLRSLCTVVKNRKDPCKHLQGPLACKYLHFPMQIAICIPIVNANLKTKFHCKFCIDWDWRKTVIALSQRKIILQWQMQIFHNSVYSSRPMAKFHIMQLCYRTGRSSAPNHISWFFILLELNYTTILTNFSESIIALNLTFI